MATTPAAEDGPSDYEYAVQLLGENNVVGAERRFREIASSCQNGEEGRRALLFLASIWLDRHPLAEPDSAAVLAARVLSLPDADPLEVAMARSIYLLALELGADPELRPARTQPPNALSLRFSECDEPLPPPLVALPQLGREPLSATVRRLERERDALAQQIATAQDGNRTLERRVQELQTELRNAEAEIERIRRLLGVPDTLSFRDRRR